MRKPKPKPAHVWIPITILSMILVGLGVGFPILMQTMHKPEPVIKEVLITAPFQMADFLAYVEAMPSCATKSNLQIIIAADIEGESEQLFSLLGAYARMRLEQGKAEREAD